LTNIDIVVSNLSGNCLGRAYVLGKVLERNYCVQILGFTSGGSIWSPHVDDFKYISVQGRSLPQFAESARQLIKLISGDVVFTLKPRPTSFGVALLKKLTAENFPLILDIDDWETAFPISNVANAFLNSKSFLDTDSLAYLFLMERLIKFADDKTVASKFLQAKFGGHYIPHAVDTNYYNPLMFDRTSLREIWKINQNVKIVAFIGTPRPHKGLENLIKVIGAFSGKVNLLLTGDSRDTYVQQILSLGRDCIKFVGLQPKKLEPHLLSMADVVAIPQTLNNVSMAQVPAKVFSAMAMAKPIIATAISDLPKILAGCGVLMKSNSLKEIENGLSLLLNDENECVALGKKARARCVEQYSFDAVEEELSAIIEEHF
jgi:glycosyltransferase involved in cell wall biosynthesis